MPYETTAVESTPAIPNPTAPVMRETREIDPYRSRIKAPFASPPKTAGQPTINSEAKPIGLEEPKTETEETVTLSPQMAALARKEQKFRQRELEFKKTTEALEAEKAEIADLKALKAKLANKDYSGIEGLVKYDEYTNYLIEKEQGVSPEQQAVKKLAEEVEILKVSQKADIEKRFEAAVAQRRTAVSELVQTNAEFSKIKKTPKAEEAVLDHILKTWSEDGVDLSVEQAAKEVQTELLARAREARKWAAALLDDEPVAESPEIEGEKKQLPPMKPQIKTLTNNMAATGEIKRPVKSFQHMSDTERWAEARRRAEEKIKQGIR